ncbi:hypothetical protein [Negativibacillus massiliensis]|uniref:hypothetical protein n=1 Tax=Negativibacillus massiliensis TaxID=1871035 RepID=UPI0023F06E23|nr:hypothetical protein [Negativibacillus massiliensis]MCI6347066.1 hypothetical protein [Negativibacillus massiliensis]
MCENTVDTQQDLLRYKQMYLRMVRAVMDAEKLLHDAMEECEELFISENAQTQISPKQDSQDLKKAV